MNGALIHSPRGGFYGCEYSGVEVFEAKFGADYFEGADPYYGSLFGDIAHAVSKAANTVSHTVSSVAKGVESLGNDALKVAKMPLHVAQGALNIITHNPVWDVAQGIVSFVPILGTAVSSGMAIAAQLGKGGSALDFALAAAKGALPGQPVSGYAFDVAVGLLLKGQHLDAKALELARSQVPGGELGKRAFDLAVSIIMGKHISKKDLVVIASKQALPKVPSLMSAFESGVGIARAKIVSPDIVAKVNSLIPPAARSAFQAGMVAAKANQVTPANLRRVAAQLPPGPVGKAMANVVQKAVLAQSAKTKALARPALRQAMALVKAAETQHNAKAQAIVRSIAARSNRGDPAARHALALLAVARGALRRNIHV